MSKVKKKIISKLFKNNFPILVAELSANHNGKLEQAKKLIKCAKENGADAVKLQTYSPDTMTIRSKKNILKSKKVYGKDINYGTYITKLKLHLSGIKNYLIMQKN